ncbi:MAG: succinate dehydrogenase, cytochrome b556 subunit [Thiotrichales bacterium]
MHDTRPVYLDLLKIKLPLPGIASILHRVSGVLLFFATPLLLWLLQRSLASETEFAAVRVLLTHPLMFLVVLGLLWAVSHHLLAGIRYLLLDLDIGIDKAAAERSARWVLIGGGVLALLLALGVYL